MTERTIAIKLTAIDAQASSTIQRVSTITAEQTRVMEAAGGAMERARDHSSKLQRQWENLTSASEYLAGGIKRVKNIIEGIMWGTVIGLVSAMVSKLIDYITESRKAAERAKELSKAIEDQARSWGLLPDKLRDVTQLTVNLYNAQLRQMQLLRKDEGKMLEKQIQDIEAWIALQREVVKKSMNFPWALDKSVVAGIAESEVKLLKARKELEEWQRVMKMQPTTLSEVRSHVEKATQAVDKLTEAMKKFKPLPPQPKFLITEPEGPSISAEEMGLLQTELESLQRRNELIAEYNRLNREGISDINSRIVAAAALGDITTKEMQTMLLQNQAINVQNKLFQAGTSAIAQAILGQQSLGKALKAALAQTMAQVAAESMVRAIFETAKGFAVLFTNPPAAAAHFKAAALFGSVGAMAGVTAGSFAKGNKGASAPASSRTEVTSSQATTGQNAQPSRKVDIHIYGNIVDHAAFVRELQPYFREIVTDTV